LISSKNKWLLVATSIGILYAFALLVFAADVFSKNQHISQTLIDLVLHFIPTVIVLLLVVIAHKRPYLGAIIFGVMALTYIITGWSGMHWSAHLLIAGPLLLMSILYVIAYKSIK
jgi:ABC-type molybdate transport system permease subunit